LSVTSLFAGESVWQPHRLQKSKAGHLPAVPWKLERTKRRVILDEGTRQAFVLNLGREALLRGALGRILDEKRSQGLLDDGFLVRKPAVLNHLSQQTLNVISKSNSHET